MITPKLIEETKLQWSYVSCENCRHKNMPIDFPTCYVCNSSIPEDYREPHETEFNWEPKP